MGKGAIWWPDFKCFDRLVCSYFISLHKPFNDLNVQTRIVLVKHWRSWTNHAMQYKIHYIARSYSIDRTIRKQSQMRYSLQERLLIPFCHWQWEWHNLSKGMMNYSCWNWFSKIAFPSSLTPFKSLLALRFDVRSKGIFQKLLLTRRVQWREKDALWATLWGLFPLLQSCVHTHSSGTAIWVFRW